MAVRMGWVARNVTDVVTRPRYERKPKEVWSQEQLSRFPGWAAGLADPAGRDRAERSDWHGAMSGQVHADGTVTGAIGVSSNITEHARADEERWRLERRTCTLEALLAMAQDAAGDAPVPQRGESARRAHA